MYLFYYQLISPQDGAITKLTLTFRLTRFSKVTQNVTKMHCLSW